MPRNIGTGIYTIPPDTEGIPDQTIESVPYNFYIHDVETDLNNPRPIIAGGTGANDADEALFNLGGERATQLVTNYDTHAWLPGSFRAAGSATGGPVDGHAFAGIVYLNEPYVDPPTNANVVVSARDMNDTVVPSRVYVREKKANVWGSWSIIDASTTTFPPGGGLSATTITAAIQELDAEKASLTFVAATYAPIASPLFTGDARAPTPLVTDNDTTIATTAFVNQAVASGLAAGGGSVDALAYSGMQINGSFDVSQESGTATRNSTGYICDGWNLTSNLISGGLVAIGQSAVSIAPGLPNTLVGTVTQAHDPMFNFDEIYVATSIEGWRIARLAWGTANAQSITIGFWTAHSLTGKYSIAVKNAAGNLTYVTSYVQSAASIAQYNTVTIPGATIGTWAKDNTIGMTIFFTIGKYAYTNFTEQWLTPDTSIAANGQVNGLATLGNVFRFAGVVVLPGVVAIPSARSALIMRGYIEELQTCKRYYEETPVYLAGTATSALGFSTMFSVEKRIVPASTVKAGSSSTNFTLSDFNGSSTKHLAVRGSTAGGYTWNATVINDARL